jgi:hypothetical protein
MLNCSRVLTAGVLVEVYRDGEVLRVNNGVKPVKRVCRRNQDREVYA